jgi:hypothetical protein
MTTSEVERLVREKERAIYTIWNKGSKESATDYLKNHFPTIPKGRKMLEELPCAIYKEANKIPLKLLVGSHIIAKKQTLFSGGYATTGEETVLDFQKITDEDVTIMRAFSLDYEEIFGEVEDGNQWYQSTPLTAFYRIWFDNRKTVPRDVFIKQLRTVFEKNSLFWSSMTKSGGRSACSNFYITAITKLKTLQYRNRPLNFVSDSDVTGRERSPEVMQRLNTELEIEE